MKLNIISNIKKLGCASLCVLSLTIGFSSCVDYDNNINEYAATDSDLDKDNLRTGGFIPTMQKDVIPTTDVGANDYQRAQNLTGDIFSGYMAAINNWNSSSNNTTYNLYFDKWNDVGFSVAFTKVMPAWANVKKYTSEKSAVFAIAQIIKIASLHRITDNHGPIPYTEFGKGGITTPYDSQEVVYKSFLEELDEAVDILTTYIDNNPSKKLLDKFDLIYGGDPVKWIKYGNSLRLRLAMRIVYVEPELAKKNAEEAVAHRYGVLAENNDNAFLKTYNGIIVYHPLKVIWDAYADTRMGASMDSYMNGYKDGRLPAYFKEADIKDGGYHGVRNGIRITSKAYFTSMSHPNVEASTPVQWMCASEMYFLRAEGAMRGWNMGDNPQNLYEKGVKVSFDQHGATLGNYLQDDTSKPIRFEDKGYFGIYSVNPIGTITIKWNDAASMEEKLERIITQKWIAMYPEGQEAWTEFRRTGYPKIFPIVTNLSGTIDTEKQIRRIPFPESEYENNNAEVLKAIELLGGADNGATKLWWDKK